MHQKTREISQALLALSGPNQVPASVARDGIETRFFGGQDSLFCICVPRIAWAETTVGPHC